MTFAPDSPQAVVIGRYPDVVVYRDGRNFYIKVKETEMFKCPTCDGELTVPKPPHALQTIGFGATESAAWADAANKIQSK